MKKLFIFFLLICSVGYKLMPHTSTKLISEDQLVKIIVDLELTKTLIYHDLPDNEQLAETIFQEQQALIFEKYAIDKAIFQQSYEHYLHTPQKFKLLQEAVITQLEQMLQQTQEDAMMDNNNKIYS
jgi:hypothetical protein